MTDTPKQPAPPVAARAASVAAVSPSGASLTDAASTRARDRRVRGLSGVLGAVSVLAFAVSVYSVVGGTAIPGLADDNIVWLTGGQASTAITEGQEFYRAEVGGKPIGFARVTRTKVGSDSMINQMMQLTLTVQGQQREVTTESAVVLDPKGAVRRFSFNLDTPGSNYNVLGETKGNGLDIWFRTGDQERATRVDLEEPPVLDLNLTTLIAARGLAVGRAYKVPIFDPQSMANTITTVRVTAHETIDVDGKPELGWRLEREADGNAVKMWIRDNGEGLVAEGGLGIRLVRTTRNRAEAAQVSAREGQGPDLIDKAAIKLPEPLEAPATRTTLSLKIENLGQEAWDLDGARQTLNGKTHIMTITRENFAALGDGPKLDEFKGTMDVEVSQNLSGSIHLQVWHPSIQLQASQLVHGIDRVIPAARRIANWVYNEVEKTNVIGVPSALEVLESKKGDCNEHATLMTALCRAAGIPARVAVGLAYVPSMQAFAYHAWVEVWAGEWIPVDPTWDQFPADVTHVRLLAGGMKRQFQIGGAIGKIGLAVVP